MPASLRGVFPVLPTPFLASGAPDLDSLLRLVDYLVDCGVDGITFPGVASEFSQLSLDERVQLGRAVIEHAAGRVPVIIGATHGDAQVGERLVADAAARGAAAVMVAAPAGLAGAREQVRCFQSLAAVSPQTPLMLQNVPPPVGAGLDPAVVLEVLAAVPQIRYVKEEALPSGQRLTRLLAGRPASLLGVFGGAGGRYITDELRRGAAGTMPAIELAEIHVALWRAHLAGDAERVRRLFTRMLPVLNIQAVFRWALTKYVLHGRGLIAHPHQRMPGPALDALDRAEVDSFLADLEDLLPPPGSRP